MKLKVKISHVTVLWVTIVMAACSGVPSGVISPGSMAELLADIHEGEGVIETERGAFSSDSMRMVLRESIYQKHGVTQAQVDSSMMWYGKHIDKYMEVYDDVIEILEKRLAKANTSTTTDPTSGPNMAQTAVMEGDSVDVWTASRHRQFYAPGGNNYVTYRLNRDGQWQQGDNYTLAFKSLSPRRPVSATILIEYNDGSTDYRAQEFPQKGWNKLDIRTSPEKDARSVSVVITYDPAKREVMYIDSISLVRQHSRTTVQRAAETKSEPRVESKSISDSPQSKEDENSETPKKELPKPAEKIAPTKRDSVKTAKK